MNKPKCRYCGQPMIYDGTYYDDMSFTCNCDGYQKELNLVSEIESLKYKREQKIRELENHRNAGEYLRLRNSLEQKIRELDSKYEYMKSVWK